MPQLKNLKEPICKKQTIGLIGAGGHSKVIQDLIFAHADYSLCAVLDDQFEETVTQSGILYGPISMSGLTERDNASYEMADCDRTK